MSWYLLSWHQSHDKCHDFTCLLSQLHYHNKCNDVVISWQQYHDKYQDFMLSWHWCHDKCLVFCYHDNRVMISIKISQCQDKYQDLMLSLHQWYLLWFYVFIADILISHIRLNLSRHKSYEFILSWQSCPDNCFDILVIGTFYAILTSNEDINLTLLAW